MLCSLADGAEESAVAVSLVFVASVGSEVFEVPEVVESELDVVDEVVLDALEDFSEDEVVDVPVDAEVVEVVEVDSLDQIAPALDGGATHLLLDNMAPDMLRQAVAMIGGRVPTEASGGVRLDTIRAIAETGVTYISVGRLTQSAPAADIGLDFTIATR